MNPLCCIAPVSVERGAATPVLPTRAKPAVPPLDAAARTVSSKQLLPLDPDPVLEEPAGESGPCAVAGILYKWVNYGKGWRSRWFVLKDGVLAYYKVHGPDKISVGAEAGVRVIGEDSLRRVRKGRGAAGSRTAKQWKPSGEIHLKESATLSEKLVFTGLDEVDGQTVDAKESEQICVTSYSPRGADMETMEELALDPLPVLLYGDDMAFIEKDITDSLPESCGFVPDSPVTPFGEKLESCVADSVGVDTSKLDPGVHIEIISTADKEVGPQHKRRKLTIRVGGRRHTRNSARRILP